MKTPRKVPRSDLDSQISWICHNLGLVQGRDTENITQKLFATLLRELSRGEPPTSERLSQLLAIEQQRVNYHLRALIKAGLVKREKRRLILQEETLEETLEEIRRRMNKRMTKAVQTAKAIDEALQG